MYSAPVVLIDLPRLVGSRNAARKIVAKAGPVSGAVVSVNCEALRSAPPSFADELVRLTIAQGDAHSLVISGGPDDFFKYVTDQSYLRGVQGLVIRH